MCFTAVSLGIDLMDSNYSSTLAEEGLAAAFPVDWQQLQRATPATRCVDIKDQRCALDSAPLLLGCSCAACSRHSRSYLHHLWNTHEMLAEVVLPVPQPAPRNAHPQHLTPHQVLLAVHNLHHCRLLLQNARAAVAAGKYNECAVQPRPLPPPPSSDYPPLLRMLRPPGPPPPPLFSPLGR